MMKNQMALAVAFGLAGVVCTGAVLAAEEKKEPTAQQQRMADCNKKAGDKALKGDERKQFMSSCLSGKADETPAATSSQQNKMKSCNEEASKKSLKGDDRKKFMSTCLSG
jgi:hypothetical protein